VNVTWHLSLPLATQSLRSLHVIVIKLHLLVGEKEGNVFEKNKLMERQALMTNIQKKVFSRGLKKEKRFFESRDVWGRCTTGT